VQTALSSICFSLAALLLVPKNEVRKDISLSKCEIIKADAKRNESIYKHRKLLLK
jgi:hypothetical protein